MILAKKNIFLFLLITGMMISCDSKRVFEENRVVEKGTWNVNHKITFTVAI